MGMKRRRPDQKDGNNDAIRDEAEAQGVNIIAIDRPVDWLVRYRDFGGLVEVKDARTEYKRGQLETAAFTPWPFAFVKSTAELMAFVKTGRGVTEQQRKAIQIALIVEPTRRTWTASMMRRILN